METATVGQVIVSARIENMFDLKAVEEGRISADQVRRIEVPDARVDTGATYISMPKRLIEQLGLAQVEIRSAKTATGPAKFGVYEPVKITIQGRDCEVRVNEVSDSCPVLIGYIPLELLDFVVDPKGQRLIGNPDHDGEWMFDMYHQEINE
jgi:predicted aspartyl protease